VNPVTNQGFNLIKLTSVQPLKAETGKIDEVSDILLKGKFLHCELVLKF
jgi:hypothetical protein